MQSEYNGNVAIITGEIKNLSRVLVKLIALSIATVTKAVLTIIKYVNRILYASYFLFDMRK